MDDLMKEEVRKIALEQIRDFMQRRQYSLSLIPNHEHSGMDSAQIRGENLDIRSAGITFKNAPTIAVSPIEGTIVFSGGVFYVCEVTGAWKQIVTA